MAAEFNATTDRLTLASGLQLPRALGTLSMWFKPTWNHTDGTNHTFLHFRGISATHFTVQKYSDNKLYAGWHINGTSYRVVVASGDYSLSSGVWYHLLLTWNDSTNNSFLYLDNVQEGTYGSLVTANTMVWPLAIGNYPVVVGADNDMRGLMAEVAIWSVVLDAAERAALAAAFSPSRIRPASRVAHWPLGGLRGDNAQEHWGGFNLANTGVTWSDHPRLFYGGQPQIGVPAAAAVGNPWYYFAQEQAVAL